jgi:hypothetical protein
MSRVHFLHIGKTGGSAIKHALEPYSAADRDIVLHDHTTTLAQVPVGEQAIFVLRDPVQRFVSAFNSRKRKGRPRYNSGWRPGEAVAFGTFATPNDLATGLSAPDPDRQKSAVAAMRAIQHVGNSYVDWLKSLDYVRARQADILWVGRTERLTDDFSDLVRLLRLPSTCCLPSDPVVAHRRLESDPTTLSPEAINNLKNWYRTDYSFIDHFFGTAETGITPPSLSEPLAASPLSGTGP